MFTPTLTGLADRSHLLARAVNLETHILDVVNLMRWEELTDIVLCGHSYGCVVSGVADRVPEHIRALVYLDAFVLEDGDNQMQHLSEAYSREFREGAKNLGEGWKVPPVPAAAFKVNAADREWVDRQCTMQPIETMRQHLQFTGGIDRIENVTYIRATGYAEGSPFPPFYEKAKAKGVDDTNGALWPRRHGRSPGRTHGTARRGMLGSCNGARAELESSPATPTRKHPEFLT